MNKVITIIKDKVAQYPVLKTIFWLALIAGVFFYLGTLQRPYEHVKDTKTVVTTKKDTTSHTKTDSTSATKIAEQTEQKTETHNNINTEKTTHENKKSNWTKTTKRTVTEKQGDKTTTTTEEIVETDHGTTETNTTEKNTDTSTEVATNTGSTTTETNTNTTTENNTQTTENTNTTTETHEVEKKGSAVGEPSRLGGGIDMRGNPVVSYDVVRLGKNSLAATAELSIKDKNVRAAGAAITRSMSKNTFVGVGVQHVFKENKQEVNAFVGIRF